MTTSKPRASKPLRILFVAAEAAPFAKIGGLGEVLYSLPKALRSLGHDARVFIPKYASINSKEFPMERLYEGILLAPESSDPHGLAKSNVVSHTDGQGGTTYFLENMEFYEKRANVYGYVDDTSRWLILCRGAAEFLRRSEWVPDVIVANDWAAGFLPNLLATEYKSDPKLSQIATVFLIHNLQNQGMFSAHFVKTEDADNGTTLLPNPFAKGVKMLNGMRRGIMFADMVSTVSPTYAKEILTSEFGEKLEEVLAERKDTLTGIMNGIDMAKFNPATDGLIKEKYSSSNLDKRIKNKIALQRIMKLPRDEHVFIVGFVGRLDKQKGINLFMAIAPALFDSIKFQFILVGTGDQEYRMFFKKLQEDYPDRVSAHLYYDDKLPKHIFAGADAILMPSRFEPAGLVQIESMRYGAIPIVRHTGGLADTVTDYYPGRGQGTGFVFRLYDSMALLIAIVRAWQAHRNKREWRGLMRRAMKEDFSWTLSAQKHIDLYRKTIRIKRQCIARKRK